MNPVTPSAAPRVPGGCGGGDSGLVPLEPAAHDAVPLRAATRAWLRISLQTFGGPAGQIAVMQRELVEERGWIGQRRFLHALSFCTLLPGPEAQQLAIYTGWLLNGIRGGLIAGILFVLPGVVALLALSALYVGLGETTAVVSLLGGLAPAVVAIVAQAVVRIGRRSLGRPGLVGLAVLAFVVLTVTTVPFPVVIAVAAGAGWALGRRGPAPTPTEESDAGRAPLIPDDALHHDHPSTARTARVLGIGLLAWGVPLGLVVALTGTSSVFTDQGLFFSGTALVTFGGAYAVLAFVAQRAVEVYGWLAPGEMVRGLALAESTPGPLIMVVQFVAFVGAYRDPGGLNPWVAAVLGALLTTWVTFVPCFVLVFLGAPWMERVRGNRSLAAALAGVTAAVVGVIAHLGLFFAGHTLFDIVEQRDLGPFRLDVPDLGSIQWFAVALTALAGWLLMRRSWSPLRVLGLCAGLGLVAGLAGVPVG